MLNVNNTQKLNVNLNHVYVRTAHVCAQNSSDNFPSYPPDNNHHSSDDVYWRRRGRRYASAVLATALSVCPSVTSRHCIETAKRTELVFGAEAVLGLCYTVLKKKFIEM